MYNSQYYTCEQIDERLLQGYLDDYNSQTGQSLTKAQFLTKLGSIFSKEGTIDNTLTQIGYYECDTAAGTAAKVITVANYSLFAGGSMKVKFVNKNTANNATLNINSQGAKALYYNGVRVSSTNTWDAGEVVEIYYDGTSYYANNVKGSTGDGVFDISVYNLTEGQPTKYASLSEALGTNGQNVPVQYRKGGMSVKFVQSSDNKYVQYRLMSQTFSTTVSDWQGVDDEPTAGSNNLVKSGGSKMSLDSSIVNVLNGYKSIFNINLFDPNSPRIKDNYALVTRGGQSGVEHPSTGCLISDYIPFTSEVGSLIYSNGNQVSDGASHPTVEFALYDKDLNLITAAAENPAIATWESGVAYARFTILKSDTNIKITMGDVSNKGDYTPFSIFSIKNSVIDNINLKWHNISGDKIKESIFIGFTGTSLVDANGIVFNNLFVPSNLSFRIKVSPVDTEPGRCILYIGNSNTPSNRIFDSNSDSYNTWYTIQKTDEISKISVFFNSDPQEVTVDIEIPSAIIVGELNIKSSAVTTDKIKNGAVTAEKLDTTLALAISSIQEINDKVNGVIGSEIIMPVNLLNTNDPDVKPGYYINTNTGSTAQNSNWTVTGFIPVVAGKTYYFGYTGNAHNSRTTLFYDSNKQPISSSFIDSAVKNATAPENASFMRCSLSSGTFSADQVSADSLKDYHIYVAPYIQYSIKEDVYFELKDDSISKSKLDNQVRNKVYSTIGHFSDSGVLSNGEYLTLPNIHIQKNNILACDINGNISNVAFGVGYSQLSDYGYRDYAALWVTVDDTYITQYRYYNNGYQQVGQVEHGLTLTPVMKLEMVNKVTDSYFRLWDNLGNSFETPIQTGGCGQPFVYNGGNTEITCKLSDYPMDLHKPIWLFGDSYISFTNNIRWPYYLNEKGYVNWLSNNQPGLGPNSAWNDLQNLLSLGYIPKKLVWLLGMNGTTTETKVDGEYVINSYQKTYIDNVINICNEKGIDVVLGVIPTVPSRQKTGFGKYVKSLGVKYIDFAYAVGTNELGEWNEGLLSSDGVHPTEAGAKVLASQVMVDCPELTLTC